MPFGGGAIRNLRHFKILQLEMAIFKHKCVFAYCRSWKLRIGNIAMETTGYANYLHIFVRMNFTERTDYPHAVLRGQAVKSADCPQLKAAGDLSRAYLQIAGTGFLAKVGLLAACANFMYRAQIQFSRGKHRYGIHADCVFGNP